MGKEQTIQTTCPYCGVGCGVLATPQADGTVSIEGDSNHPANLGRLCSKGSALGETVDHGNRLLHPKIDGKRVPWDEALNTVSRKFNDIIAKHGPNAIGFYVSGQILTEDYYTANKLMKGFIGSANIDTNSRLCMSSAVAGYKRAFGSDSVPCSYEDLEQADLLVITGSNLAWCHPVIFQRIRQAKEDRPEMKVVVIDPRTTATCDLADLHLPLRPGSDASLFNGLLNYLKKEDYLDLDFLEQHTEGFSAALKAAKTSAGNIPQVSAVTELPEQDIIKFYQLFASTEKVITLYSQGVNQSTSGTDKSNSIINCHLATGRLGKPAMGPFSMTGQPNAMGGREVGGLSNQLAAHMEITNPEHHDRVSRFWETDRLATENGAKAVDLFNDVGEGKIKAVWIMATNPVVSLPDADKVKAALEQCELVVVSECESNTDTTELADILLPAAAWGEKDGTVTNSERRISHQRQFLIAPGEARPDWWIITQVARKMGFEKAFPFEKPVDVFREHARLSAFENNGSRDFDLSGLAEISDEAYEKLAPIQWPVSDNAPAGTARLFTDYQFFTPNGKARMVPIEPKLPENKTSDDYPLVLNTGRIRDQWHTMTRTGRAVRLNAHIPEPMVQIHPVDAQNWGLVDGALAQVSSKLGKMIVRVVITDEQRPGSVFVPIHWSNQSASLARVDALVAAVVDPISGQPESKHTPVKIRPYQPVWHGFILSRHPISVKDANYWVKVRGGQFWRYEIAGEQEIQHPDVWAQKHLGTNGEWLDFIDKKAGRYRAGIIVGNRLEGVVFVAPDHDLPARSWLSQLFTSPSLTDEERYSLLVGQPGKGQKDCGAIVCSCFGVGENTLKEAIAVGKLTSVDEIGNKLNAGTNCGSCIPELKKLLGH
ncbi:nitrate reductase [Methylophaga thiooxydans]|uniref:nitrate reductase (cytochrome) n=1 Tax=Methylophaga thiooxydans DMS010 TaxID=637616 RepID=C0N4M1_9GAMM|nr:nitrate reductase [Methylophaga thiooxydans]EEF80239.1 Molybdopterin oxidoreductase Fe4S4 domain family [Methylophaga thiooxydans DMS010]